MYVTSLFFFVVNEITFYSYCFTLGDAYFFKDNLYWVLKNGGLNQEFVTPQSIAVDWLRCPAPPTAHSPVNPQDPKECSCGLNGSSSFRGNSWLLLIFVILIIDEFIRR